MQPATFAPPPPFTLSEFGDDMPERVYNKEEVMNYLRFNREKCKKVLSELTKEKLNDRWINESGSMNYSILEILLYNLRHVQHHAGKLNLLLRQTVDDAPRWVFQAEDDL